MTAMLYLCGDLPTLESRTEELRARLRRTAREAEFLARTGINRFARQNRPDIWFRPPSEGEAVGDVVVVRPDERPLGNDLTPTLKAARWSRLTPNGIPDWVPYSDYRRWLENLVSSLPLIRTVEP